MHILLVNDDGPPDCQSSPYVHAFAKALQARGHVVSVVLPHVQRSWIGKAHFVHDTVKPTYFRPGTVHEDDGTTHERPLDASTASDPPQEEWVLINGTPATCTQMGLFHFYRDRGPVDIVVSGPNFGRNSTALFALSSGTIGGALEAAVCGHHGIALSFAFSPDGRYLREPIEAACRLGAKLVEHLAANWDEGVDIYNVNVPLLRDVETRKVVWTYMLANKWKSGSAFREIEVDQQSQEVEPKEGQTPERREAVIRKQEGDAMEAAERADASSQQDSGVSRHQHRHFKWFPSFKDVHDSVQNSEEGNDGWAVWQDYVSVTPLNANFMLPIKRTGELKLSPEEYKAAEIQPASGPASLTAFVKYEDAYVQPLIEAALAKSEALIDHSTRPFASRGSPEPFLQISQYESIDHELLLTKSEGFMANSYTIRKALIRKEYLASVVRHWAAKNPGSILSACVPETISLNIDYAEFLDDALMEGDGMTLMPMFEANSQKDYADRSWWMVKASMADRGQGIRLFSTFDELQTVFEGWEAPEEVENEDEDEENEVSDHAAGGEAGMTSNLRHFVLQQYITPFLLDSAGGRKFHVRCYVVAVGALKVYVYRDMLALFSAKPYETPAQPADELDLATHLTNTCLQDGSREGSVEPFWSLPEPAGREGWKEKQWQNICTATGQLFQAAVASPTDFQPLPNAFELYGVDWLIGESEQGDGQIRAWLLEVNAYPDLKQTGNDLKGLIAGLWDGIVDKAISPYFKLGPLKTGTADTSSMQLVLDHDMGR